VTLEPTSDLGDVGDALERALLATQLMRQCLIEAHHWSSVRSAAVYELAQEMSVAGIAHSLELSRTMVAKILTTPR
jgi:hypothetical protein